MLIAPRRGATTAMLLSASSLACSDAPGPAPDPTPDPPLPARVLVSNGDGQIARIGTRLPAPIVVTVLDGSGQPVPGIQVEWRALGDDQLFPATPVTDDQGHARADWLLGESEGRRQGEAGLAGVEPAVFTAIAEGQDALPFDQPIPLDFATYDGSRQVVHPDYAATPAGTFDRPFHLAITPYPFGNPAFENPSFFEASRRDTWALTAGTPNPVVLPHEGYLSDPDLVYVPESEELWLYYRVVTDKNLVRLVRTHDGHQWSVAVEVARGPNHALVSPSVVRRAADDWWMFAVNAGPDGCNASATAIEVRRSADGLHWGPPEPIALEPSDLWPWHIDVQWIPSRQVFWAVYNAKPDRDCATPAVYLAQSSDGLTWAAVPNPVLTKGTIPTLQDIVYRTTFEYDELTDAITFWFSGARFERTSYAWRAAVERRHRADVFAAAALDATFFTPAPAPLKDWP